MWCRLVQVYTIRILARLFFTCCAEVPVLGASRAPSHGNLGALIRICGPWFRNVKYLFIFYVLTLEVSRGLSGP